MKKYLSGTFAAKAAEGGTAEVSLGQMAAQKATDADVKNFDNGMVKDHEKDAKEFEKASKDVQDPGLKSWASKTLPVIQDHLRMAKQIASKLK
jgi:predicted outer membrane protein